MIQHSFGSSHRQQGAALLVSMLLLLGLTVVGIASMRETVTQQKVINAVLEDDAAFQAAEFALRAGEEFVLAQRDSGTRMLSGPATSDGVSIDVFDRQILGMEWWKDRSSESWDEGSVVEDYPLIDSEQSPPSYVIEVLGEDSGGGSVELGNKDANTVLNYRITARGFGVNENYYVVLQSTVGVQY